MCITETPTVESVHREHDGGATTDHHNRHSSKRKFDDDDDQVSGRMKKEKKTTSSRLQFFVRMMSQGNSLVIQAWGEETVESVHKRIERMTGIPIRHQRLIYRGKQLQCEKSLDECGIQNDANLQLAGHLRSGGCPMVWQIMHSMVSLIYRLCRGEFVHDASRNIRHLMTMHFNKPEYFSAFMSLKAPSVLVTLYVSPYAGNKGLADSAIRYFLSCCRGGSSNGLQDGCLDVVLELCRLLRRVGGDDPLYRFCRGGFTSLLETVGGVCFWIPKRRVLLQGVFNFVRELADGLLRDLDLSMDCLRGPCFRDVHDFTFFLVHLRNGIGQQQQGLDGSVIVGNRHQEDPLIAGLVDQLRVMYVQLLSKMDECLHRMEVCLANKEQGEGEGDGDGDGGVRWSQYLSILKELYQISKLYDGAEEKFWRVLLHRRSMLSQLIVRYAKRIDDHQWVLEHKTVTNFESRRHLAMMLFPDVKDDFGEFHEMFIDRSQLLAESFKYIARAEPESLQGGLFMEFKNEDASGPGVLREWFLLVCQAIFNPRNDLFVACPNDCRRFFPNPG